MGIEIESQWYRPRYQRESNVQFVIKYCQIVSHISARLLAISLKICTRTINSGKPRSLYSPDMLLRLRLCLERAEINQIISSPSYFQLQQLKYIYILKKIVLLSDQVKVNKQIHVYANAYIHIKHHHHHIKLRSKIQFYFDIFLA